MPRSRNITSRFVPTNAELTCFHSTGSGSWGLGSGAVKVEICDAVAGMVWVKGAREVFGGVGDVDYADGSVLGLFSTCCAKGREEG